MTLTEYSSAVDDGSGSSPPDSLPPEMGRSGEDKQEPTQAAVKVGGPGVAELVQAMLVILAVLLLGIIIDLVVVSRFQYDAAQHIAFDRFRSEVAEGTAPVGQTDAAGHLLALGTPVALIDIPAIGMHNVVVGEGTTARVLMRGPGHRRDTPLPGQGGAASYIFGRQAAFGGPFAHLSQLRVGDTITVTTGEGTSKFKVIDLRYPGDPEPPALNANQGRLTLETASGTSFLPSGVLLVDADQTTPVLASSPRVIPVGSLPKDESAMASQTSNLWGLVLWLEALIVAAVGTVWSWSRWGHPQTWIVFVPVLALVGYFVANQAAELLPNLL